jgi:hypothetical protein
MDFEENGPFQKANIQLSDASAKLKISKGALIAIIIIALCTGPVLHIVWINYQMRRSQD